MIKCIIGLFLLSFITLNVCGQNSRDNESNAINYFLDKDTHFQQVHVPDSLSNESAVIIAHKKIAIYNFKIKQTVSMIDKIKIEKYRIKLMDRAAVESYSSFEFPSASDIVLALRVVKKNGEEQMVDFSNAVEVVEEQRYAYKKAFNRSAFYSVSTKHKKISIPNLEPGDILDVYFRHNNCIVPYDFISHRREETSVDEVFESFLYQEPILYQTYEIHIDQSLYMNCRSIYEAPEFSKFVCNAIPNEKFVPYQSFKITDSIPKNKKSELMSDNSTIPAFKYQVFFIPNNRKKNARKSHLYFFNKEERVCTEINKDQILRLIYDGFADKKYENDIIKSSKIPIELKQYTDSEEYAKMAFTYLRNKRNKDIYKRYSSFTEIDALDYSLKKSMSSLSFAKNYIKLLLMRNIKCELIALVPQANGTLSDLISPKEIQYGVRITFSENKTQDVFSVRNSCTYNDFPKAYRNAEYWVLPISANSKDNKDLFLKVKCYNYSESARENQFSVYSKIKLDFSSEKTLINQKYSMSGEYKNEYYDYAFYNYFTFPEDDAYLKQKKDSIDKINNSKSDTLSTEHKDKLKEFLQKIVDSKFEINKFRLLQSGRFVETPNLEFEIEYAFDDFWAKVGNSKIILNVGQIIGNQTLISKTDSVRKSDIYIEAKCRITNNVSIEIPVGYKIENIESLTTSLDNECCSFKTTATLEGSVLQLSTEKVYKHNFDTKDKWPLYVEMLNAAYAFSQKKIILKKE